MLTKEEREKLEALNYDHHLRMKKMHEQFVRSGQLAKVDGQDAASREALLLDMRQAALAGLPQRVLELGTGSGRDCAPLVTFFSSDYFGVEVVSEVAQSLIELGLNVTHCPVEEMPEPWAGSFGYAYSRHVMEHVINVPAALKELHRVLAPGGVVGAVTPDFPHEEPAHVSKLTLDEWVRAYEEHGFRVTSAAHRTFFCKEAHVVARKI